MNGAIRISGALVDTPIYGMMKEEEIKNYATHRVLFDIARTLYYASHTGNIKALVKEDERNGKSPLSTIMRLDEEFEKIKTQLRKAFLVWDYDSYKIRNDKTFKFASNKVLISLIEGEDAFLNYRGKRIHASVLLKVPPICNSFLQNIPL